MGEKALQQYIKDVSREYRTEKAQEHAYRPALKALLETFEGNKQIQAINEPAHIDCGAPDFVVQRKGLPIGYIEAKDIGKDLKKVERDDQLKRYRQALGNLILTDCLEFRWYVDGELRETVRCAAEGAKGKIIVDDNGLAALGGLLERFLQQKPLKIGRPRLLAIRLAGIARLIREIIGKALAEDANNGEQHKSTLHEQLGGFRQVLMRTLTEDDFADMYAQTIVYGMFAARENHRVADGAFTRERAAYAVPKTNPFLRKLFNYVAGPQLDARLEWAIKDLVTLLNAADMAAIRTEFETFKPGDDPVVHFYETFLKTNGII